MKYYQEKGLVSKMEISEENSSENSFKNAVKKALENCENKDTEKKKIKDDLIIFILENESQSTDRKVWKERFNELEKKEAEDIIKEVCDLLAKKNKDMFHPGLFLTSRLEMYGGKHRFQMIILFLQLEWFRSIQAEFPVRRNGINQKSLSNFREWC